MANITYQIMQKAKCYLVHILQVANRKKNWKKNYKCYVVQILQVANRKKISKKLQVVCYTYTAGG